MALTADVINGLHILSDEDKISDAELHQILHSIIGNILPDTIDDSTESTLSSSEDTGVLKQAHASLVICLIEAAKQDKDGSSLRYSLEDLQLSSDRLQHIIRIYDENKDRIRVLLSSTSRRLPCITDVRWRLFYYIKNKQLNKVNEPRCHIELQTEDGCVSGAHKFSCSHVQLQDMVGKLKDACKSLERASLL